MRVEIVATMVFASVLRPGAASAEEGRFGGRGQVVISDDQPFGSILASGAVSPSAPSSTSTVSFQYATISDNHGSGTSFVVSPALDYFAIDGLSLGGSVVFGIFNPAHEGSGSGTTVTLFAIAPRIGVNIRLGDSVSFWPKMYFGYATTSVSDNGPTSNATAIGIFAPFLFHPVPHFFVGIGPNLSTQLSNNVSTSSIGIGGTTIPGATVEAPKVTQLGLQATFGGWLGD
jgi:hypothetical protein